MKVYEEGSGGGARWREAVVELGEGLRGGIEEGREAKKRRVMGERRTRRWKS